MWQTDWAQKTTRVADTRGAQISSLSPENVSATYCLFWSEHCLECAVPDCYEVCPLYVSRGDGKCARFKNGILPNPQYPGLFEYGAEIEFRRWGKLESNFGLGLLSSSQARRFDRMNRASLQTIQSVASHFGGTNLQANVKSAYASLRQLSLQTLRLGRKENFDEFVIEVWNLQDEPVRLVIECWQNGPTFRSSVVLEPGRTVHRIPATSMNVDLYGARGMIRVFPENDIEAYLIFSWLDFVKYRSSVQTTVPSKGEPVTSAANKVKCVIWDLDNTAWDGLVAEQNPERVSLRPGVLEAMHALDERGILQSIASKNDFENACLALEQQGISHLFLCPQINWRPKSVNIRSIVDSLNIGVDSCMFIDDSAFERAEVAQELPGIRVLADSDVPGMLDRPEFKVPITAESKQRRAFYIAESKRKLQALDYGDRYEAFLQTCKMEARVFRPRDLQHVERCLELLHRSNQLNLSTHRYTRGEFEQLLKRRDVISICTDCRDKFGEYGIVGFASVLFSEKGAVLKDFVLSCRVAQKKVENAWFQWLAQTAARAGYRKILAPYVKTARNGILLNSLLEVGFIEAERTETGSLLELDCDQNPPASDIVSITADSLELQSGLRFSPAPNRQAQRLRA